MNCSGELPMKILAIEFSSPRRNVAVVTLADAAAGDAVVMHRLSTADNGTPELEMIDGVLRRSGIEREQIDCLAIGTGPGSYTGIRSAIALAQGWQLATEVKLCGVSSADFMAAQAVGEGIVGELSVII